LSFVISEKKQILSNKSLYHWQDLNVTKLISCFCVR